jgi:PTS system nitrogen regulatory IIA component
VRLTDLLSPKRVAIQNAEELDKHRVLEELATMLGDGASIAPTLVAKALEEREARQSTGIGEGVAIPHGFMAEVQQQVGALMTVPKGVAFDAIDGADVNIVLAVIGPKHASGEHLKTLARISRVLRSSAFRERQLAAPTPDAAFDALVAEDEACHR